jgi:cell division septation protein DedD
LNLIAWIPIVDVQAKDRLTGAVILVVLLVLVIPELLSGPGRKAATVATPRSDEPPLRSYTVDLGDEARARHALANGPATATPSPAPAAPAMPPAVVTPAPDATPPPAATVQAAATTQANAAPAAVPSMQEPVKPRAVVASSAPPEAAPPVTGWTVQLGSFASRANAERLVRDLKAKGYAAFSTESGSGGRKLYRVRVGPAADHAAAETLAAKLRSAGHTGTLTQRP